MNFKRPWRGLFAVAAWVAFSVGCATAPVREEHPRAARDGVLVHLSQGTNSPHRVLMALKMARIMCEDHDVAVYFDIRGGEVVLKDGKDLRHDAFTSSHQLLRELKARGVGLYACPICLKAIDKTPEDLMPGVETASKEALFGFTQGRILTLDY